MVASKEPGAEEPGPDDLYRVGVVGVVARMMKVPDGTVHILVQCGQRVELGDFVATDAVPGRAHRRGARRARALARAGGPPPQRPVDLLADHRGPALPARGATARGREPRRPRRARSPDRRRAPDQDRGEAAPARGARRHEAAAPPVRDPRPRARAGRDRQQDPDAGPVRDGARPARVLPAPAAARDPGGAGRGRRAAGRGQELRGQLEEANLPEHARTGRGARARRASSGSRRSRPSTA